MSVDPKELEKTLRKMLREKEPEIERAWIDHILYGIPVPEDLLMDKEKI
jgi:hypothetical protein